MILTLKVTDDTFEHYAQYNKADPKAAMVAQLSRFRGVDPSSRVLVLPKAEREELEILLGIPLESAKELVSVVKRLLSVKLGPVEVEATPDQVYRLEDQARFMGLEPSDYLKLRAKESIEYAAGGR